MTELVEERFDVPMFEQGRRIRGGRGKVAQERGNRNLLHPVGAASSLRDRKAGEMVVLSFARKHVEVEQPQGLMGLRVRDFEKLNAGCPHLRWFDRREGQPKNAFVNAKHSVEHGLIGEINAELLSVDGVTLLLELVGVVVDVPGF